MSDLLQTLRTVQEWLNGTGPADDLSAFEIRQIVDDAVRSGGVSGGQIKVPSKGWLRAVLDDFTHACCKRNAGVKDVTRASGRSLVDMLHDALVWHLRDVEQETGRFTEDDLFQAFIEGFESRAGRYYSYVWEEWDKRKDDLLERLSSGDEESTLDEEPDAYRYRYPTEKGWRYATDRKDLPPPLLVDGKWNDVELEELYVGDEEG